MQGINQKFKKKVYLCFSFTIMVSVVSTGALLPFNITLLYIFFVRIVKMIHRCVGDEERDTEELLYVNVDELLTRNFHAIFFMQSSQILLIHITIYVDFLIFVLLTLYSLVLCTFHNFFFLIQDEILFFFE